MKIVCLAYTKILYRSSLAEWPLRTTAEHTGTIKIIARSVIMNPAGWTGIYTHPAFLNQVCFMMSCFIDQWEELFWPQHYRNYNGRISRPEKKNDLRGNYFPYKNQQQDKNIQHNRYDSGEEPQKKFFIIWISCLLNECKKSPAYKKWRDCCNQEIKKYRK